MAGTCVADRLREAFSRGWASPLTVSVAPRPDRKTVFIDTTENTGVGSQSNISHFGIKVFETAPGLHQMDVMSTRSLLGMLNAPMDEIKKAHEACQRAQFFGRTADAASPS